MNSTVPSITEVNYHCRKAIQNEVVNSVCLISGSEISAPATTKARDDGKLKMTIKLGSCATSLTRAFMPQNSRYCNNTFILTPSVSTIKAD